MTENKTVNFSEEELHQRLEEICKQRNHHIDVEFSKIPHPDASPMDKQFTMYRIRWGVLLSVAMLNISNASIWINYLPVATTTANYYNKKVEAINWFSLTYLIMAIPGAFYGTYCVDKWGLKKVIWAGALFNVVGATVRTIATSGWIADKDNQFAISLTGQVICSVAQNFVLYLHTKVSQTWFSRDQRGVATTIVSMSNPMGIVVAEVSVPYIVNSEDDIPTNDKVWLGVAVLTVFVTFIFVRRGKPRTPPSQSADVSGVDRPSYLQQLKIAFTTVPFLLLVVALGGGVAFTIAVATITQQILCPLGYTETFSGSVNGLMLLCGFGGAILAGLLLDRTKMYTEITIYLYGIASFCGIVLFEFLLVPDRQVILAVFFALFGIFGVGLFPVGLELAVETTYPVEESITTAFIFLVGQLLGIIMIALVPVLAREMSDTSLSVCNMDNGEEPKDYTVSVLAIMIYLAVSMSLTVAFFKTEYKRQNAEQCHQTNIKEATVNSTP